MNKRYEITAIAYDKKGNILSVGKNNYVKTHPLQKHYSTRAKVSEHKIYIHAELDALIRARGKVHKIVVMRFNADGKPANAKPCPACQLAIKDFGVKHVEHT